jgi:hypothetical protein
MSQAAAAWRRVGAQASVLVPSNGNLPEAYLELAAKGGLGLACACGDDEAGRAQEARILQAAREHGIRIETLPSAKKALDLASPD